MRPHMAETQVPNWENYPNLDDVITEADLDSKGSGKFAATYVNWCKVSQLLRKYAPGWQFELRTTTDDQARETHVFRAPDGSGYLVGFFRAPTGSGFLDTPDFPQAIMEARTVMEADGVTPKLNKWGKPMMDPNASIPWDEITARDVTDTHRRCMATAAAAHFGLAYQLWARESIENPMRDSLPKATHKAPKPKASSNPPAQAHAPAKPKVVDPLDDRRAKCRIDLAALHGQDNGVAEVWRAHMKNRFNGGLKVKQELIAVEHLTTEEMVAECETWIANYRKQLEPTANA